MNLIKQIINLIRIQKSDKAFDKAVITRLSVNPKDRDAVREWHKAKIITKTECDR